MTKNLKKESLIFRCTKDEKKALKNKAKLLGKTVSKLIIDSALNYENNNTENTDIYIEDNNRKHIQINYPKSIGNTTNSQVINELRRLGGLQKHLFNEGLNSFDSKLPQEFYEVLQEIKAAIKRIGIE